MRDLHIVPKGPPISADRRPLRQASLLGSIVLSGLVLSACGGGSGGASAPATPTNFVLSINGTAISSGQYNSPTNPFQWPGGTSFTVGVSVSNFTGTFTAQIFQTLGSGLCWAVKAPATQSPPATFVFTPTLLCLPGVELVIVSASGGQATGGQFYIAPTF